MIEAEATDEEGGQMVLGGTGTDMVVMSDAIVSVLFLFLHLSTCLLVLFPQYVIDRDREGIWNDVGS